MRILLLAYYFPPFNTVGALRTGKWARHLHRQGHAVHVIACGNQPFPRGLALEIPEVCVTWTDAWSVNAPIEWLKGGRDKVATEGFQADGGSAARRLGQWYKTLLHWPDAQLGWVGSAHAAGRALLQSRPFDLIYASAPPHSALRVAAALGREFKLPWVGELRDLWTDNHGYAYPAWRRAIERRWERALLGRAAALVTVSEPLAAQLARFGRPAWAIRNGYSPEDFENLPRPDGLGTGNEDGGLDLVFTGNVYADHYDLDTLCAGLARFLAAGGRARLHIVGRNSAALLAVAQRHGIAAHCAARGTIEHRAALALQRAADVLVTFLWDGGSGAGLYSAKLFEYAGAARPVLAIGAPANDVGRLLEAAGLGSTCPDAHSVAERLAAWQEEKRRTGSLRTTPTPGFDFSRAAQFRILEERLAGLIGGAAGAADSAGSAVSAVSAAPAAPAASVIPAGRGRRLCFVTVNHLPLNAFLAMPIARLVEAGWEVTVAVNPADGPVAASIREHARIVAVPIVRPIRPLTDLRALWRLWRFLRAERFDIVHSVAPKAGLLTMLAAWGARVPVRLHTFTGQVWATRTGPLRWLLRMLDRVIAGCATALLTDSFSQSDFLIAEGVVGRARVHVLGQGSICGVDTARFAPDAVARREVRAQLGIAASACAILFVGRLHPEKGIAELLEAFCGLAATRPEVHLVLVGPDEGAEPFLAQAGPDSAARIHRVGLTPAPQHYMAAADIFCLPSYREGFGLTLIEAAAAGLPAVATRIYGVSDAVLDGSTGLLVPPRDATALRAALAQLADNADLRARMGAAARARALADFEQQRVLDAWLAFYERCQAPGSGPGR